MGLRSSCGGVPLKLKKNCRQSIRGLFMLSIVVNLFLASFFLI
jgi:hypothetical protein